MDRVAAEIAEEIGVLLQHHYAHARAREQETEHHPGRAAAGDAALVVIGANWPCVSSASPRIVRRP